MVSGQSFLGCLIGKIFPGNVTTCGDEVHAKIEIGEEMKLGATCDTINSDLSFVKTADMTKFTSRAVTQCPCHSEALSAEDENLDSNFGCLFSFR